MVLPVANVASLHLIFAVVAAFAYASAAVVIDVPLVSTVVAVVVVVAQFSIEVVTVAHVVESLDVI